MSRCLGWLMMFSIMTREGPHTVRTWPSRSRRAARSIVYALCIHTTRLTALWPAWTDIRCISGARLDVLVDVEEVGRVVRRLHLCQLLIVVAVGGFDHVLALVHNHVDVGTTGGVG